MTLLEFNDIYNVYKSKYKLEYSDNKYGYRGPIENFNIKNDEIVLSFEGINLKYLNRFEDYVRKQDDIYVNLDSDDYYIRINSFEERNNVLTFVGELIYKPES